MNAGKIFERIAAITAEIDPVGKSETNVAQRYNFRSIDDIVAMVGPLLSKHKVFITPLVEEIAREEGQTKGGAIMHYALLKVRYRFYSTDGSYVDAVTMGEGADAGDKACNKAMSAAYKYALLQTFAIPTDEKKDSEYESPERGIRTPDSVDKARRVAASIAADTSHRHTPWRSIEIHFGKNKGKTLGELAANQLNWYIENWQPRENHTGSISAVDEEFRLALDEAAEEDVSPF